jgi:DNA-directed RNA polymerase sigma subunit (sigma70/sigma32)
MSTNFDSNSDEQEPSPSHSFHRHRSPRDRAAPKRVQVRIISQGQYREVLARLSDAEADMLRFRWGMIDGQVQSVSNTAEKFAVQIDVIKELETRALNMVSEL